ncbi:hypothetical protein [Afipia carboxidovorans]|uniref:hypothetical protein n=1 Tax=Afipia carboxidovorans TaxID=40137 RepID=UPI00308A8C19|nr:hypothetical protein CRBSH125_05590 [Afipia carboxidovorans]
MAESYWQEVYIGSPGAQENVKSWFAPMCDGMTLYKAELLCDIETDREKKIRAFMTDPDGRNYQFERTRGGKKFSITRKLIAEPRP